MELFIYGYTKVNIYAVLVCHAKDSKARVRGTNFSPTVYVTMELRYAAANETTVPDRMLYE